MDMCIPTVGTVIKLSEDWTFGVYQESRNDSLINYKKAPQGFKTGRYEWEDYGKHVGPMTFPKDTILKIERIYIRKGQKDFDSISFSVESTTLEYVAGLTKVKKPRFWAKLADVNTMKFEFEV